MQVSEELVKYGGKDAGVLERFMKEFFPFQDLKSVGFWKKELRGEYYLQAKRVCIFFGYESVFEYGSKPVTAHLSYVKKEDIESNPFIYHKPSIYD